MFEILKIILEITRLHKLLRWLHVLWVIFRFARRIHNTFHDADFASSALKTSILRGAMDAVSDGDVHDLINSIHLFDHMVKNAV